MDINFSNPKPLPIHEKALFRRGTTLCRKREFEIQQV